MNKDSIAITIARMDGDDARMALARVAGYLGDTTEGEYLVRIVREMSATPVFPNDSLGASVDENAS